MASRSVNKVILLGHLGKDAETKFTPSGVAKTTFAVATKPPLERPADRRMEEETTDWHNVVLWRSENVANYLLKGKQVYVEGRLEQPELGGSAGPEEVLHRGRCGRGNPARRTWRFAGPAAVAAITSSAIVPFRCPAPPNGSSPRPRRPMISVRASPDDDVPF